MGASLFIGCVSLIVLIASINYLVVGDAQGLEGIGRTAFGDLTYHHYKYNMTNDSREDYLYLLHGGSPVWETEGFWDDYNFLTPINYFLEAKEYWVFPDGFKITDFRLNLWVTGQFGEDDFNFWNSDKEGSGWVNMLENIWVFLSLDFEILTNLGTAGWIIRVPLLAGLIYSMVDVIWIG